MYKKERKNKKTLLLVALMILTLLTAAIFTGCSTGAKKKAAKLPEPAKEVLTGPINKIATDLTTNANKALPTQGRLPRLRAEALSAAGAEKDIGVATNDFTGKVQKAENFVSTQNTAPCQLTVLKCNDPAAASGIKRAIAAGYNLKKWKTAAPEQCFVTDAGSYVLLFAGTKAQSEALQAGITTLSGGKASPPNIFFAGKSGGGTVSPSAATQGVTTGSATKPGKEGDKRAGTGNKRTETGKRKTGSGKSETESGKTKAGSGTKNN